MLFVDDCIAKVVAGTLDTITASMAKYWTGHLAGSARWCVQLHGGYGYMNEYLVCRMFADSRVQRIYGGTNEIMKSSLQGALSASIGRIPAAVSPPCRRHATRAVDFTDLCPFVASIAAGMAEQ